MGTVETKRSEENEMFDFEISWDGIFDLLKMILGTGLICAVFYIFVLISFSF